LLIQIFCERITSKRTVNANELYTYVLPGSCQFIMRIICGVDCMRAEFMGSKQTYSLTYRHSSLYISCH